MPLSPRNRKKPGLRENDDNAQFSLCCTHRLSRMTIARSSSGFFSSTLSFRAKVRNLLVSTKKTCFRRLRTRVAWDLIRFDINRNNDTVSTERQQNSRKEITT